MLKYIIILLIKLKLKNINNELNELYYLILGTHHLPLKTSSYIFQKYYNITPTKIIIKSTC